MFNNELTKEFPCWNCTKYDHQSKVECPILMALMDVFTDGAENGLDIRAFTDSVTNLTFECSKQEIPVCKTCGATVHPDEEDTETEGCLVCCQEDE